jgi:hypothetical protein
MKKLFKLIGIITLVAIIGFSFATCSDGNDDTGGGGGTGSGGTGGTGGSGGTGGEGNTNLNSWYVYRDASSTATVEHSIAADGVCTVNVGGTPEKHGVDGVWNAWKINAQINYTVKANTIYTYKFEVWTESGARGLQVQYYHDPDENLVLNENINITSTRQTYTFNGQKLPKGGQQRIEFQCAHQTGKFHVKMLEIKEYNGSSGGDPSLLTLSGDINISPSGSVAVNTQLRATYSGSEWVSYQWKKGNTIVMNSNVYTPTEAGSYTVTVSAPGYNSKTSAVIDVNNPSSATLSGSIIIKSNKGISSIYDTYTELIAMYSGSETVTYQWKKDGNNVGTNSDKYTPTEAGSYAVTVSAAGYNPKTSDSATVRLSSLSGDITISPGGNVAVNIQLTATYSGSETVTYQWKKDGNNVGTNSNKYTPTEAGRYAVTVSAPGYNSKYSTNDVTVMSTSAIQLTANTWADGYIPVSVLGGVQWFKFTATASTQYIHIDKGNGENVYVYDSSGIVVGSKTDTPNFSRTYFSVNVTSGQEYYISVRSKGGGTYQIGFTSSTTEPTMITLPTDVINASRLIEYVWADDNPVRYGGDQWFKFTATATTQYIHVASKISSSSFSVSVQVYDLSGTPIGSRSLLNSYDDDKYISRNVTSGQEYYIRASSSSNSMNYFIGFTNTTTRPMFPIQPANILANGNLPKSSDVQVFKFTATASTQNIHLSFGTLDDLYVLVYDSNGAMVGDETRLYGNTKDISRNVTNGQEYFIKVRPCGSKSGTYKIVFNKSTTATTQLTANIWANGNLSNSSDEQWFYFIATASTQNIHVSFGMLDDLYVQVYDSDGTMVGDETRLYGNTKYISRNVTNGQEYYIKVRPDDSKSGTYKIVFNKSTTATTQLTANIWANGNLSNSSDEQWFYFTATASTQNIHVSFGTLNDLYVQVYDSSGTAVGVETNLYNNTKYISRNVTNGQEYYIKVRPYSSNSGTYKIAFNTSTTVPN